METIGLMAAMTQESDALLRCVKGWKRIAMGPFNGKSFELCGQTCLLVTSGMGVRRASEAARYLVEMNAPRMLISFGIAGAVGADLQIGDAITANAVCRLEQRVPGPLLPLASWSEAAREAAVQVLSKRGARLWSGTAVTTNGTQIDEERLEKLEHPILEMETAGIAQVAASNQIPLLSLRAISDGPCDPIPFDLGEMMDEDANLQAGRLLKALVRRPRIILQSRRLMRNTRIASDNAAIALIAALSQMILEF
jgi:adenosylhomocysteine nucleosidase